MLKSKNPYLGSLFFLIRLILRDVDPDFSLIDGAVGASSRMIEGTWGDPIVVSFAHNSSLIEIKVIREIRFSFSLKEIS